MTRTLQLVLLLFMSVGMTAQVVIRGVVSDELSGQGLPDCNILIKGTLKGTVTNTDGRFELEVESLPTVIIVSEVAHHTREITVRQESTSIVLQPLDELLGEVELKAERILYSKMMEKVRDFDFYDDKFLVLHSSGRRLLLIDDEGKEVSAINLQTTYDHIHKDCLGNLHITNEDSSHQVFYDYVKLRLIHPYPRAVYDIYVGGCEDRYEDGLIYHFERRNGLVSSFFFARGGVTTRFFELPDTAALNYINKELDINYFIQQRRFGKLGNFSVAQIEENLEQFQDMEREKWKNWNSRENEHNWLDHLITSPNRMDLKTMGDSIYLFDLKREKLYVFRDTTQPVSVQSLNIDGHKIVDVIADRANSKLYLVLAKSGSFWLREFSTDINSTYPVKEVLFPSELKVRNNFLYFIVDPKLKGKNYLYRSYLPAQLLDN